MKLDEILNVIKDSKYSDWYSPTNSGGTSYKYELIYNEYAKEAKDTIKIEQHTQTAVYKENILINIAYGMVCKDRYEGEWLKNNKYPDKSVSWELLDVFYGNVLVYRMQYLRVDGHNTFKIPLPIDGNKVVLREEYEVIKALNFISNNITEDKFKTWFDISGFEVKD